MKSRTSFFNGTLFRKNLLRFAPLWAILLGMMVITGPVALMSNLSSIPVGESRAASAESYLDGMAVYGCVVGVIFAVLCAACCFSYLHKARSAYMMHAFPMTRDCHFVTNTLSCLVFALVPYGIVTGLNLLVLALYQGTEQLCGAALLLLAKWTLQYLCFLGLAVFCMHLTGNTVIGVLSYAALSFIGWALPSLLTATVISPLFYGFDKAPFDYTVLSPVIRLVETGSTLQSAWIYVYAALGIALLVAAWLHYRVRHMERAGDAMVYGWAKAAFLILFTVMVGLLLGNIFYLILTGGMDPADRAALFTVCLLIALFVGYLGARMMLGRTIRVFRSKGFWLGYAAFALVTVLGICALKTDVLGWQRRLPDPKQVESVEICTRRENSGFTREMAYWTPLSEDRITVTEPEGLALVNRMHKAALAERDDESIRRKALDEGLPSYTFYLVYHLKNGGTVTRAYEVYGTEAADCGRALFTDPAYVLPYYEKKVPLRFDYVQINDAEGRNYETYRPELVRQAMLADAKAGRLPIVNDFTQTGDEYTIDFLYNDRGAGSFLIPQSAAETLALFHMVEELEPEYVR